MTLFALASCGKNTATTSAQSDPGDTTTANHHIATCQQTCSSANDCGVSGDPLYSASHFSCNQGVCQWLGCKSASECNQEANGGNFLCMANGGPVPSCVPACQSASDCVPPNESGALNDASHFACVNGACQWTGCKSTAECSNALHTSKVACEQPPGAPAPTCVPVCNTASDCVVQGSGVLGSKNHYACVSNRCEWLGCKSTSECRQAMSSNQYICQ